MPTLFTRSFGLLIAGQFLQNLAFASLPLVPLLLLHLGATRTEIGLIMALGGLGGVLLRPLVGWALDTIGRGPVLYLSTAITAATMVWLAFITDTGPQMWANRLAFGFAMGASATAFFTLAIDGMPASRRTEGIALFGIAGLAGMVVNPIAGELGLSGDALARVFVGLAALVALSMVPVSLAIRRASVERSEAPKPPTVATALKPDHTRTSSEPPPGTTPTPPEAASPPSTKARALIAALLQPTLRPVWLITMVFAAVFSAFLFFGSVAAEARGVPNPAFLWFTYAGGAITVRLLGARLPDLVGPHNLIAPALGFYGIALVIAAGAQTSEAFLLAGLLGGMGHGYFFPCAASLSVQRMPDHLRGTALASFTALLELASMLAAPILGLIAQTRGDDLMFATAAVTTLAGLIAWAFLEHHASVRLAPAQQPPSPSPAPRVRDEAGPPRPPDGPIPPI